MVLGMVLRMGMGVGMKFDMGVRMRLGVTLLTGLLTCANATGETLTLTLEQATQRALETDPRIAERQHLVGSAQALLQEVHGNQDWKIDANTFLAISSGVEGSPFQNGGCVPGNCILRSDKYDIQKNGVSPWLNLQLTIIKPLYTFGKVENYATAAQANMQVKEHDVRIQRAATVLDVKRAYYGYLAAKDSRRFLEDVRTRISKAIEVAQTWLDEGESDMRQADIFALQAGHSLISRYIYQTEGMQKIALEGLKVLTGLKATDELQLAEKVLSPVALPGGGLSEFQQQALTQRPEILQVAAGLKARHALVEARRADAMPNLYAGVAGVFSYSPNRDRLNNPYIYDPFNEAGLTPMIGLKWDWQRGVQRAKVAQEQAELNALIAKSSLAQQGIPFQVAEQYYQVQSEHAALQELNEGSRHARRWMVGRYADFEAGLETADRVITAFQGYVVAQTDYIKTIYEYNMRVAQLQNVAGTEPLLIEKGTTAK